MAEGFDWRSALIASVCVIVSILVAILLAWRSSNKSFREFVCGRRRSSPGTDHRTAPDLEQQAGHEAMPLNRLRAPPLRRSSRLAGRSHSSPR